MRRAAGANVPDEMVTLTNLPGTDDMVRARNTMRVQPEEKAMAEGVANLGRFMELVKDAG